jgi:hypothetical protein
VIEWGASAYGEERYVCTQILYKQIFPGAAKASFNTTAQQTIINLFAAFFCKLRLANQDPTMDAIRSHAAGPTKAAVNKSEIVTMDSALCVDLLKAGALSMKEIDKLIGELQRAHDYIKYEGEGYKAKQVAMRISVGPLLHR